MPEERLQALLGDLTANDVRVDPHGRITITNPDVSERLKEMDLAPAAKLAAKGDTNIICCGNTTCRAASDLGALVERFSGIPT